MKNSLLMLDSSETDGKAEIVMDYVMSFSLRMAADPARPVLNGYCRHMLGQLLQTDLTGVVIRSVEVWKEWHQIDLTVEVELGRNGITEKHAILIENKYYGGLHDAKDADGEYRNQLEVYRKKFDDHYLAEGWQCHYALVSCIERTDPKFETNYAVAADYGFSNYSFYELLPEDDYVETESEIFNEFWLRSW